ncbi:hypothetical protein BDD43_3374 [Mucilaginibacter gracilis]|uniref:Uncharacterized protein n=1 Tax=Mucilaginibacter gracilis TaxID=423350 RepID=A0A495J3I5_9SPHI|nr:hypothetical protein [Mucilaginibacter gracilis]RKR83172.1 hypothetical protein BDD43_3374 [Mucilaginibacter gracilis]
MEELRIIKKTSSLGDLVIKPVEKKLAKEMIVKNHYSHKWNDSGFGIYNFGIFKLDEPDRCIGVAVYGLMKNPKAKIFEHPRDNAWMCELNRMWIADELGMNAETVLIGASIKLLKRIDSNIVAIQSFADGRLGCGTIYKAANFKYYGYHYTKFLENKRTGEVIHEQLFTNSTNTSGYMRNNLSYLIGDFTTYQVKTYRYIYPLCKHFKFNLKKEQPFPEYEKSSTKVQWERNTTLIKERLINMIYTMK